MNPDKYVSFKFNGQVSKLYVILLVNYFFTIISLGLYYPWAKAKLLQFYYSETEFHGSRFVFHGTGKEMFKGYIKVYALFVVLFGSMKIFQWMGEFDLFLIASIISYMIVLCLIPMAIHGVLRYRLSRSSWRGIHFGYRGELLKLYLLCIKGILLSILTLGLYIPWMLVSVRRYVFSNIRFGNLKFSFNGDGGQLLGIHVIGYLLSIFTLGIYLPWYLTTVINYKIINSTVKQNREEYLVKSTITGWNYFVLGFTNILILVCTLGLGMPFVTIREIKYYMKHLHFSKKINFDILEQTESDYRDATGEDLTDALDLNFF